MSLYDIIQNILDVSKNHNLVREVGEGDIYNYLNSSEHQYPCVFLTVSSINDDLNLRNVNCTLFYVDRLTSDESNKILVQSLGLSVLSDIVERIAGDVDTVEYTTFTEKFTDLCGGVYASLSIGYPLDGACSNDFEVRELEVTENGVYDVLGYDRIVVSVEGGGNQEEIEELEQELEAKLEEINNLQIEVEEKTSQIQTLQIENESLNQQITQKDGDISELESQIEENNSLIFSLQQDVESLNQQIVDLTASILEKDDEITSLNNQINSVTTLSVTENGTYIPEEGVLGWNEVTVQTKKPVFKAVNGTRFATDSTELPIDIDSTGVTDFYGMFCRCINLTTVPLIDTSKGKRFDEMFAECENLITIPQLDTSNGTEFYGLFYGCKSLTTAPLIDTSNGGNFSSMFDGCSKLTTISQLDTSNGTSFSYMFRNCVNLTTIPQLDTSKGVFFRGMFEGCSDILSGASATIPQLDTSNGYDFSYMFNGCLTLKTIPPLDTSSGANFSYMFGGCNYLKTIPPLDLSKGNNFSGMFDTFPGFTEYLQNVQFIGSINYSISFSSRTRLTYESVKSILTACSNTTNTDSKTLTFNITLTDQNGELANLITTCNSKGWTVGGLTLQ